MLKHCICTCLVLFMVTSLIHAQSKFEGKVNLKITNNEKSNNMDYFIKDGKIRIEVKDKMEADIVFDPKAQNMIVIMPQQKMYMELPYAGMAQVQSTSTSEAEGTNKAGGTFNKTGETKDILGYKAEKWTYTDGDGAVTEAWLTKELGSFMFFTGNPMMHTEKPKWQSNLENNGLFPLLVTHKEKGGNEDSRFEVTSVEKKELPADLFTAPSGFKKMDVPGMGR